MRTLSNTSLRNIKIIFEAKWENRVFSKFLYEFFHQLVDAAGYEGVRLSNYQLIGKWLQRAAASAQKVLALKKSSMMHEMAFFL